MFLLKSAISDSSSLFRSFNVYHLVFFKGVEFFRFSVIPAQVFLPVTQDYFSNIKGPWNTIHNSP